MNIPTSKSYYLVKRFVENYNADPDFRLEYKQNPKSIISKLSLPVDSLFLNEIIETASGKEQQSANPFLIEKFKRDKLKSITTQRLNTESITNLKFNKWRLRQLKRVKALYHDVIFQAVPTIPIAFELTKGCSGQCSFCCFDPPSLNGVFKYSNANRNLWRDVLKISKEIIGPLAGCGICYYETEPLDNPDYEKFITDFYEINNSLPQTTTIRHLRNKESLRKQMNKIGKSHLEHGAIRFSITSLEMLKKVHAEYSAEELEHVELVLNNPESNSKYSPAGRARQLMDENNSDKYYMPGPVSCGIGFIINMVDSSIKLIAMCNPNEINTKGYILFDSAIFKDSKDFKSTILDMINRNMLEFPDENDILSYNPMFKFEECDNGIKLSTRFLTRHFKGDSNFIKCCELINRGTYSWNGIKNEINNSFLEEIYLKPKIKELFDFGVLNDKSITY